MHPFSYSCDAVPGDVEDLIESSLGAAKALKSVHGTAITVGSLCEQLYRYSPPHLHAPILMCALTNFILNSAPGNVVDWMYAASDIPFSYSLSLRDTGTVRSFIWLFGHCVSVPILILWLLCSMVSSSHQVGFGLLEKRQVACYRILLIGLRRNGYVSFAHVACFR